MTLSYHNTYAITQRAAIDLSLSENPLGASPKAIQAIIDSSKELHVYPHNDKILITLIARHHGIPEEMILLGAGANQLLEDCLKVFALRKILVVPSATFPESVACMLTLQGSVKQVALHRDLSINLDGLLKACTPHTGCIHLCNPNNPTGIWTDLQLLHWLSSRSRVPILVSEAGADFVGQTLIHPQMPPNILVVRSFSKAYGLAGLRIGYGVASPRVIATLKAHLQSYRVSSLAIAAAIAAIQDQRHLQESIAYIMQEKLFLMHAMQLLGFTIVPSQGQTFIAKVPKAFSNAHQFCSIAREYGIAVVNCALYAGLEQYIRISPQKHEINKEFISLLNKIQGEIK